MRGGYWNVLQFLTNNEWAIDEPQQFRVKIQIKTQLIFYLC